MLLAILAALVSALHVLIPTMARMLLSTMMLISAMVMILVISPKPCLLSISFFVSVSISRIRISSWFATLASTLLTALIQIRLLKPSRKKLSIGYMIQPCTKLVSIIATGEVP